MGRTLNSRGPDRPTAGGRGQRRGRAIAMGPDELGTYLDTQRTCRLACVGADGSPHVTPLWFVWDGNALWINSLVRSQRWADLMRDGRAAVVVDDGQAYRKLRGVEMRGTVEPIGEAPRTAEPDPALATPERLFARKYQDSDSFTPDGRHGWLRLRPEVVRSWDFRKIPGSPD